MIQKKSIIICFIVFIIILLTFQLRTHRINIINNKIYVELKNNITGFQDIDIKKIS